MAFKFKVSARSEWFLGIDRLAAPTGQRDRIIEVNFRYDALPGAVMRLREFLGVVSSAATWPLAARAQQGQRVRRIGFFSGLAADDPESRARLGAFLAELQRLGWTDGRNARIDYRWGVSNVAAATFSLGACQRRDRRRQSCRPGRL